MRSNRFTLLFISFLVIGAAAALADTGLTTVWRPGAGIQWVRWGMTFDDFKAQDGVYFGQGLRVKSLAIRDDRVAAIWQPGDGAQWVRWGMTFDDFKAQDAIYFPQGLRVTSLEIDNGRVAAVWRPGDGVQWIRWGMTFDEFKAQDAIYFPQGLRVAALEIQDERVAAVWRPGEGAQWVRWGMSVEDLTAQDTDYFNQGFRLTSLVNDHGRYAAVWQPGEGTQWWASGRCGTDFSTEDAVYFAQGLRMQLIELQDGVGSPYQYPWKSGDSYSVGQGNNNPSGSHNGVQAFAFDFSLPSGTTVRAARAGVVEWLQQNQTTTYDPSQPTTPTNTPFPNGSLQNWGNAVRIRHAGGFTSWYFHPQPNTVTVNVGDTVQSGQPIATSDNTGRSSGAHLHFQVQADSIDWGPSVSVDFGACQLPNTGDSATSNNANPNFP
jgi:murein DD-endopeptidase MepM/ murein hydrolase activator NlpD